MSHNNPECSSGEALFCAKASTLSAQLLLLHVTPEGFALQFWGKQLPGAISCRDWAERSESENGMVMLYLLPYYIMGYQI